MPSYIGLDIGKHSIKAAVVDGSAKAPRVRNLYVTPRPDEVPGETEAEKLEFLIREFFLEHRGLGHHNVVIALGEGATVVRTFTVEFTKDEQIRETMRFNAEPHFHLLTMEEVVLQYTRVSTDEGRSRIYAAVAKKRDLRETLDVLQKSGIDPVMVDLNMAAIANCAQPCLPKTAAENGIQESGDDESREEHAGPPAEPFRIVMDLGDSAARFIIFRKNAFFGTRVFQTNAPSGPDAEAAYVRKIAREIKRTMATLPPGHPLSQVLLTGGLSLRGSIVVGMKKQLGVPVKPLSITSAFRTAVDDEKHAELNALGAAAVGLAVKGLGMDLVGIDYRRREFQYVKKFDKIKKGLACTACLLFVIVFLWTYATQLKLGMRRNEKRVAEQKLESVFKTLLPGDEKTWKSKTKMTGRTFRQLVEKRKTGENIGFPKTVSALEYINTFFTCLYEAKRQWTWESGIFSEDGISVKGRVTSDLSATYIKQILDRTGKKHFASTDVQTRLGQGGEYMVDYRIETTESKKR